MELMKGRLVDYLLSVRFLFISASQVGRLVDFTTFLQVRRESVRVLANV